MKKLFFSNLKGYKRKWIRSDIMAALVVTAIAIPESLGFAVIVGLPIQTGLYCALLAPIVFAIFTSSKRLVVGADSATAALVASGAATLAVAGTPEYANAIAVLGLVTGAILLVMSAARFGFMADLISQPVLVGFVSGVGVQLLIGKLPEMLGLHAHGNLLQKLSFIFMNFSHIDIKTMILAALVVAIIVAGWKLRWPGALIALLLAISATKLFNLPSLGIDVVGQIPQGFPTFQVPHITPQMITTLLPAAFSIAVVILAQSLAVIRNSAARHEEKVKENQDLLALGLANTTSALVGGFAINGSPPRTSAGEMAGGRSQLVNVIMALLIGVVLLAATGLFAFVPTACLAAVVFSIGLHLLKIEELKKIWLMRKTEFVIAMIALVGVASMGVQQGVMIAVVLSLIERLRRQYHPHDEILLQDQVYGEWAVDRLNGGKQLSTAPEGLLIYRFNDALFFENTTYFMKRVNRVVKKSNKPVKYFVLDSSAISDIDYTAAQALGRLYGQLNADDIQFCLAHVSPRLRSILKKYGLIDLIGKDNISPSLGQAIEAYKNRHITNRDRINALGLAPEDYVVIGGAVLEFLRIRETNDVDLVVSKKVYDRLSKANWKEYIQDDGKHILSRSGYIIMQHWMGRSLTELQKSSAEVDGIQLMGLEELIECKTQLGRKKDLKDVASIKDYEERQRMIPVQSNRVCSVLAYSPHLTRR